MSTHNATSYFKSHRESRLAFVEECVLIWHDDRTDFLEHVEGMRAVEASIRKDVMAKIGSTAPEHVEHFVAVELTAFRNELIAREIGSTLRDLHKPRPKKGNVRRHIPKHLPLRPSRAIIAVRALMTRARDHSMSINAVYARVAEHFNHGIPRLEADGRLTTRSVRSACENFGAFDGDAAMMANYRRAVHRYRNGPVPHVWDWTLCDAMIWSGEMARLFGRTADEWRETMPYLLRDLPLVSFERLYDRARAHPRFAKLTGVDLARAIDAHAGLVLCVEREMDAVASLIQVGQARTANVAA